MSDILDKLKGGDLRSIGRSNEVVADVFCNPTLFGAVFAGMLNEDPVVRMRAADAVEKISEKCPQYLLPRKTALIRQVAFCEQQEVRWHVAQMISRIELNKEEWGHVTEILFGYINDKSKIVQTSAMQALEEMAEDDENLRPKVVAVVEELSRTVSAAVRNRGLKLLVKLKSI